VEVAVADMFEAPLNSPSVFSSIPSVKLICINSTGFDLVNIESANENNVLVSNVPGFGTEGVAELNIALMFAILRHLIAADKAVRASPFQVDPANSEHNKFKSMDVRGKTLGVVGLGQIGTRVAEIGVALGMNVVGYNRSSKDIPSVEMMSLDELLKISDVVSLNIALSPQTRNLVNEDSIKLMKKSAFIINTARGDLIDDTALAEAIRDNRLAGAGLDFLGEWSNDNPLLALDNVVITPHIGWYTQESLDNLADIITENIENYAKANPVNLVSYP